MTRVAVLADIHGNLPALEAVLADMRAYAPDAVVVAGDAVNWGGFSAEVTQVIYERRWPVVRGNNEYYLLDGGPARRPAAWAHFTLLEWLAGQLRGWQPVIAAWPDDLLLRYPDAPDLHVFHGLPGNPWAGVYPAPHHDDATVGGWLADARAATVVCGHTHLPLDRQGGTWRVINPGSVGVPLDGQPTASYMVLDGDADGWRVAAARRVPFDVAAAVDGLVRSGFVAAGGPIAELALEELQQHVIRVHAFLRWHWDAHPGAPQTPAHLAAFRQLDPRPYAAAPYRRYMAGHSG